MKEIAIILTCFNRREKTLECLSNLSKQKCRDVLFSINIYLVDDGSTDGTAEAVSENYPLVNIVKGTGDLFWNRGMYTAWKTASEGGDYDYYLWLNDDTNLFEFCISRLLEYSQEKNDRAIICGCTQSKTTLKFTYGGRNIKNGELVPVIPNGALQVCEILNGNCVLVPRYVFKTVGNLDWTFVHSIGDFDYGLRAKKLGIESFATGAYIGYCEENPAPPKWCLPEVSIGKRIKNLYSPFGKCPPPNYFVFELRHFGILTAIKHFVTIHIRVMVPSLWKKKSL